MWHLHFIFKCLSSLLLHIVRMKIWLKSKCILACLDSQESTSTEIKKEIKELENKRSMLGCYES